MWHPLVLSLVNPGFGVESTMRSGAAQTIGQSAYIHGPWVVYPPPPPDCATKSQGDGVQERTVAMALTAAYGRSAFIAQPRICYRGERVLRSKSVVACPPPRKATPGFRILALATPRSRLCVVDQEVRVGCHRVTARMMGPWWCRRRGHRIGRTERRGIEPAQKAATCLTCGRRWDTSPPSGFQD
jgi:hypothetical protein